MRGKLAFVLGATVGYVLGTRAGRERYEQIKRASSAVWQTEPVQRGVGAVKGVVDSQLDEIKAFVRRASSDMFSNMARRTSDSQPTKAAANKAAKDAGVDADSPEQS